MCLSWCGVKNSSGPLSLLCPGTTLDSSSCGYFSPLSPLFHLTCKGAFAISEVRTRAQQSTVQGSSLCLSRATVTEDSCQPDCLAVLPVHLLQGAWQVTMDLKAHLSSTLGMLMLEYLMWLTSCYPQGRYGPLPGEFFHFYGFLSAKPLYHCYWCPKPLMDTVTWKRLYGFL